jgi:23S rRNA (cytidine1920-2'-O)/16S rRNA (cytidine1409-2'-O)-methyltransferase
MKKRIDVLLVDRGLAPTRSRAQALIMSGNVLVNDRPVTKAGEVFLDAEETLIRVRGEDHPYVSRGGVKLAKALEVFGVSPAGKIGLDIGASTGGFTEVLLLAGASKVHAVDVGHSQLDWKIRSDARVKVYEKVNARELRFEQIGEKVGIIVMDVSFISLEKIFPAICQFALDSPGEETDWITLIKPQFEVGREKVGKGGIVTSESDRLEAIERLSRFSETLGLERMNLIEAPITGTDGNKEFLAHWKLKLRPST